MQHVTKLTQILAFLQEHDGPNTQFEEGKSDLFEHPDNYSSRSIARFEDGAVMVVATSYEPDYSEVTPGEGFTITWSLYEVGEY